MFFTIYLICFLAGVGFSALSLLTMFAHGIHFHHGGAHLHHGHGPVHHGHGPAQQAAGHHGAAQHGGDAGPKAAPHAQSQNVVKMTAQKAVAEVAHASDTATPWLLRFNLTALVLFLAIFGGVGLLLEDKHELASLLTAAIAVICGFAGSTAVTRVLGAIIARERPLEPVTFTGTVAQVTIPIREGGGTGEIIYTLEGTRRCSGARSDDGRAIGKGAEVVIVRYDKGIAYVASFDEPVHAAVTTTSH
jgi:hypothetical protein